MKITARIKVEYEYSISVTYIDETTAKISDNRFLHDMLTQNFSELSCSPTFNLAVHKIFI